MGFVCLLESLAYFGEAGGGGVRVGRLHLALELGACFFPNPTVDLVLFGEHDGW